MATADAPMNGPGAYACITPKAWSDLGLAFEQPRLEKRSMSADDGHFVGGAVQLNTGCAAELILGAPAVCHGFSLPWGVSSLAELARKGGALLLNAALSPGACDALNAARTALAQFLLHDPIGKTFVNWDALAMPAAVEFMNPEEVVTRMVNTLIIPATNTTFNYFSPSLLGHGHTVVDIGSNPTSPKSKFPIFRKAAPCFVTAQGVVAVRASETDGSPIKITAEGELDVASLSPARVLPLPRPGEYTALSLLTAPPSEDGDIVVRVKDNAGVVRPISPLDFGRGPALIYSLLVVPTFWYREAKTGRFGIKWKAVKVRFLPAGASEGVIKKTPDEFPSVSSAKKPIHVPHAAPSAAVSAMWEDEGVELSEQQLDEAIPDAKRARVAE